MTKMGTIHERIECLVKTLAGGKNTAFAAKLGVSEANIRGYIKGVIPKADVLQKIVISYDIDATWLLTGKGDMLKAAKTAGALTADGHSSVPVAPDNTLEAIRIPHSSSREEEIEALRLLGLDIKDIDPIPFVSTQVAAGFGSDDQYRSIH